MPRMIAFVVAVVALFGASAAAVAQNYPNRPITLVIGFSPGGPSDVLARILTRRMEQELKQPFVVENRTGAGGSVAGQFVARAAPDGYTLMLASEAALAINPSLYKNLGYDAVKDFSPIGLIGTMPQVIYTHPSVPAKTLGELIALIRANPGKYNFGSGGVGTPAHLAGELLKMKASLALTHVPFRGTGPALQNVIAGHVQMAISSSPPLIGPIQAGSIRPLGVTTPKRSAALPDVPTFIEGGVPDFAVPSWHGVVGPAGMPSEVVSALARAMTAALNDADFKKQIGDLGVDAAGMTPDEFRAFIAAEIPKIAEIVKASGAKAE